MTLTSFRFAIAAVATLGLTTACSATPETAPASEDVVEVTSDVSVATEDVEDTGPTDDAAGSIADVADTTADVTSSGSPELGSDGSRLRGVFSAVPTDSGDPRTRGVQVNWYDTKLDTDCRFVETEAGVYRCVPIQSGGLHVFTTPTCEPGTDLMALLQTLGSPTNLDCTAGYVWYGFEDTQCAQNTRGHAMKLLGPATASLQSHGYVATFFGDCNARPEAPPPPDPGPKWRYCTVEDVPDTAFVSATVEVKTVGSARQVVLTAEDGAMEMRALLHPDLDVRVYRDWFSGTELIPDGWNFSGLPAGAPACSMATECPPEGATACARAMVVTSNSCSGRSFAMAPTSTPGPTCDGETPAASDTACYLEPTDELAHLAYSELRLGNGRLKPIWIQQGNRPVLQTGYLWDEELGMRCAPETGSDGYTTHCVPAADGPSPGFPQGWRRAYASKKPNSECDQDLGYVYVARCGEPAPSFMREGGKFYRMTKTTKSGPAVVYGGVGPPGQAVYQCAALSPAPKTYFDAKEVSETDLALMARVIWP